MKFLLDTNAVIALMKGAPGFIRRLRRHRPADFGLPSVVFHELVFGACNSARADENLKRVEALAFEVLGFERDDARCAGSIRAALRAKGEPIGPYDVLIAGQALSRGLKLVSGNVREFARVDGLEVQDWSIGEG